MKIAYTFGYYLIITIIISLTMHTYGQTPVKYYAKEWKAVDELVGKGLDKDALEQIRTIYQLAKKEKQEAQIIKAAVYMVFVQNENRENSIETAIAELEKELLNTSGQAKAIYQSLIAAQYYAYYQRIRWQLYDRTATNRFDKNDIATWGSEDFHNKIGGLYLESIHEEGLLKETPLGPYDALIIKGNMRKLRPTLYDLLAFRALSYFSSTELNVKKPQYAFEIADASAFDPAADFVHRKFETRDSASLEHQALLLYQKLIAFHQQDAEPDALIDADLARLQYVRQKSVHPDKDSLYYMSVNHVAQQYQSTPAAAQAWYLKAQWLNDRGNRYRPGKDTTWRYETAKAAEICEKIISENPETEGGINAFNLLHAIRNLQLTMTMERVNIPGKPFLALVNFKNIPVLHIRLIKADTAALTDFEGYDYENKFKKLTAAPAIRAWTQPLPDTRDFQQHSVEIKIDALPIGDYILLAGTDEAFRDGHTILAARLFHVSNLSFIEKSNHYFVLDRDSGRPVAGAAVQLWRHNYNNSTRKYEYVKHTFHKTDANGQFIVSFDRKLGGRYDVMPEITHGDDHLFIRQGHPYYYPPFASHEDDEEDSIDQIFLFTDRGIYRPGQTVYYKGIARKGKEIFKNRSYEIDVDASDDQGSDFYTTKHKVNEYGSFSGSFTLPQSVLPGDFIISAENSQVSFKVEEYKRPRFEVAFDTLKNSYKVGDIIRITGSAVAYAGNVINEANVQYRVVRHPRIMYPWRWGRFAPVMQSQEIAHGETVTDAAGKFTLDFEAIPDRQMSRELDPVFEYTIYADITDLNGETRSNEIMVSAGYKSFVLKSDIPQKTSAADFKSLSIKSVNLAEMPVETDARIQFTRIVPENRLIRPRYWARPDVFVMAKNEFISLFPHDEYDAETEMENWSATGGPISVTAKLGQNTNVPIAGLRLSAGFYKVQITVKSAAGEEVSDVRYMELTEPNKAVPPYPTYLWAEGTSPIEPGQKTTLALGSSADKVFLISHIDSNKKDLFSFSGIDRQIRSFQFGATENDRGGYFAHYLFVKNNRVFSHMEPIVVPWTNKKLEIAYETFRDKTLPGSKETWKVKISGLNRDKIAAEMLGSMYDASLDQLYMHRWYVPGLWLMNTTRYYDKNANISFNSVNAEVKYGDGPAYRHFEKTFDQLTGPSNLNFALGGIVSGMKVSGQLSRPEVAFAGAVAEKKDMPAPDASALSEVVVVGYGQQKAPEKAKGQTGAPATRKNFNETAFFLPDLKTDSQGNITFSFTLPEALTRWKFQAFAHTKALAFGYSSREIVTQKELMVQPNTPRFVREGDKLSFPVKIANLADRELKGNAALRFSNSETGENIDATLSNDAPEKAFTVAAGQSSIVFFDITIPKGLTGMLTWRATAQSGNLSDGEENVLPVLPNRMLVTESLPIYSRGNGERNFMFEKLKNSEKSATLTHQSVTVEFTSNPSWYAIQALPYLMEFPWECAEQTWSRYYANAIAGSIVRSSPRIAQVFSRWKGLDTATLKSNLNKNQELKALLLEETPWVMAAKSETDQKKNIALLFDLVRMGNEQDRMVLKLEDMQNPNGGFPWFEGGPDDRYITQYIVTGIGHLKKMKALDPEQERKVNRLIDKALPYLDARLMEDYAMLLRHKVDLGKHIPDSYAIQYLYMRSFFPTKPVAPASKEAYQHYSQRAKESWISHSKMLQGMIALVMERSGDSRTASEILESLRQKAIQNEELGMYWKDTRRGWWWHESPIEQQALLIEAFQEAGKDANTVNELKTWLLKNKQTNNWESTKATAEACYALLLQGNYWLAESPSATIKLGSTTIDADANTEEAGTGYFKRTFGPTAVTPEMGDIQVSIRASAGAAQLPSWGAVYWQYFEDLDKITFAETPLKLSKQLFVETNTDKGPVLTPVREGEAVKVGDKIKVRIELRVDRDMEYVHMKDMRAAGLEPVNVLSGYRWQGGLGYYESTRDASTNFFFHALPKGTYVFEYPLFITHEGDFSNGITTIQCMYAPEFTAHSEGIRLKALPRK
ncbi:MAG: alpha-2-macroglobulin [Dyadobacter sp. 50-39]|mgnify:CR=1 FL=1|uniref:alpha-2-macroglobulin family protein n=1 Tax=Dyadobacter sp. 50-39 TaxID=1895756 RepID=UPI00095C41F1|nr:alpha-2-macroglobulin family protein [Dyadobacter sp. 50-39]OJV17648.1 MAG: alpha-2-macroglobulin [Dyadobacter sp. 50-39]